MMLGHFGVFKIVNGVQIPYNLFISSEFYIL